MGLPGERSGRLRRADKIRPIELATTSYGQGMTSTGLQLAMATAAIANDGVLMKPRLVTQVTDADGLPAWTMAPTPVRRVISSETARTVSRMMVSVTEPGGTATRAAVEGYRVAGKTGTAEKVKDGVYSDARIGSFMGFLPAEQPEVAIVVSVDEPTEGSRYGGIVAAPAFAEIAREAMRVRSIAPEPTIAEERIANATEDAEANDALALTSESDAWSLPDVKGRPMREVLAAFAGSGVQVAIEGSGRAVAQDPQPGSLVRHGDVVAVVFQ